MTRVSNLQISARLTLVIQTLQPPCSVHTSLGENFPYYINISGLLLRNNKVEISRYRIMLLPKRKLHHYYYTKMWVPKALKSKLYVILPFTVY